MYSPLPITVALLSIALTKTSRCAAAQLVEPAQISCNAAYSAPCARQNSRFLATNVTITAPGAAIFQKINVGEINMDIGFYPFVFDRTTKLCVAHGADSSLVGLDLPQIFSNNNLAYSDADALYARFEAAANVGGDWVQYLWSDGGSTNSKLAFVTNYTSSYIVGVGYEEAQLPPDLPCSDAFDSFCSATNVRSLVGKSQFHLFEAGKSLENFESAVYDISFSDGFKIDGGFYAFMYHYDGELKAHGILRDSFGATLPEILQEKQLGSRQDGEDLHETFVSAAEGKGWVQYDWRNSLNEPVYTKIALIVKVEFDDDDYYLGVGFNFAKVNSVDGPLGEPCSADFNLPCAFATALQLSSHSRSHAISSELSVDEIFSAVSTRSDFRNGDFYVFFYEFDGNCVAHGLVPDYVGMTLPQVFRQNNIALDGGELHDQFRDAAIQGGGWVQYDWLIPGVEDSDFQKISYIFRVRLNGKDYYGGVGFNHERAPVQVDADVGQKRNGSPVPCSSQYGLSCSEANSQAILGEALADLTLSSSDARVASQVLNPSTVGDILVSITSQSDSTLSVNDFYVMVFSADRNECLLDDLSGCCVAHGGNSTMVHHTWEEILESDSITSIQGSELHRKLLQRAKSGGGWIESPWSRATGRAQTKRWWTSRFRSDGQEYYVVVDYLKTEQPPTCESCPDDQECTRNDQSYCEPKPEPPLTENPLVLSLIILFSVGTPLVGLFFWYQKRRTKLKSIQRLDEMNQKVQQMAEQLEKQMQGMVEVVVSMPFSRQATYNKQVGNLSQAGSSISAAVWYWEEDASYLESHTSSMVLSDSTFVRYSSDVSDQLERAFQLYVEGHGFRQFHLDLSTSLKGGKIHNADTGLQYEIDFDSFVQKNTKSNHTRNIQREEVQLQADPTLADQLPPLPDDIDFGEDGEDLLPTSKGQVIQVSKVHPNDLWLYGNVLYDPLIHDAQDQSKNQASGLNDVLAHALHDRPTSGWFPKCVVQHADVGVMQKLLSTLGSEGFDTLSAPDTWDTDGSGTDSFKDGKVEVPRGSREYREVETYFMTALHSQANHISVHKIERIQNLPLWQSYSVKKQTMLTRDTNNPTGRENNLDITDVERRWLFHGTTTEIVLKVERQGFNRAFAGRNAVAYGKGVYFARDASYSSHKLYSAPDKKGIQRIFLCRVAVGDWCKGTNGQLTPDPKKNNPMELFDTTVDNVSNPSIFVGYHDAQAYPEYLVSFKNSDTVAC